MKPAFTLVDLGTLPGGSMSKAVALNNKGQVAGWGGYSGSPFLLVSWVWQEGNLSKLLMPNEDLTSQAIGINDLGQIIGKTNSLVGNHRANSSEGDLNSLSVGPYGAMLGSKGHSPFLPFLTTEERAEFFMLPDEGRVILRAINNNGHIIGWLDTFHPVQPNQPLRKTRKSFLWEKGNLTHITALDGGKFQAYGFNDLGQVVGTADSRDGDHASHAWLWQNGQITDLGTLGGYSIPHAINAAGQIIGTSETDEQDESNPVHGFLWESGRMINLDGTSETWESRPLAINAAGQIVGQLDVADGPICGFLWQDGQMHNLNELVYTGSAWEILDAVDVNDMGQIACNGKKDGITHGLLLNPL